MKKLTLIAIATLLAVTTTANAGWWKTYGGKTGNCIQINSEGNYIISGQDENWNLRLLETDTAGNIIWSKTYDESRGLYTRWLEETQDGGYIITPWTPSLLKIDAVGDTVWSKDYGIYTYSVKLASDGGYILTGGDHGNNYDRYLVIVKTNSDGDSLWSKEFEEPGNNRNVGYCIENTNDGGYVITGLTGYADEYEDYFYLWLLKIDSDGNKQWSVTFDEGIGHSVRQTNDGGYIITGFKSSSNALWLVKTDDTGDTLWTKQYYSTNGGRGLNVLASSDGGYIVTGTTIPLTLVSSPQYGDLWLLKTDSNGDTVWNRFYGEEGSDIGRSAQPTPEGGYIVAGSTSSFGSGEGLLLLKTDSLGLLNIVVEEPIHSMNWDITTSVGSRITLKYHNLPQGLSATIFDASGRKMDYLESCAKTSVITWGDSYPSGIYYIRVKTNNTARIERAVILH